MRKPCALVAGATLTALVAGLAYADLRTTPHNLMRGNGFGEPQGDGGEVCVFCHTPMIAEDGPRPTPRWQRNLGNSTGFVTYDDIGRSGTSGNTSVGSQSLACLSCHDSNQAFSVTRSDMEHPYGVPYRGTFPGGASGQGANVQQVRARGNALVDTNLPQSLAEFRPVYRGVIDDRTVWWASYTGNAARRGRGDLPLYGRIDADSGVAVPHIECSTCHDPHSTNRMFLRAPAGRGELCMTCHNN
ncbi:MAG TPA: cytochrome c3 family protein [Rhodocyclaceae bacterium]|nr:cytochrome c3 family protein [Rhodocyclaceae bacterium]HNA02402.1 cytochrome c3 family protein [Rhodocyclaceae bacterium]HNB77451.1 cytochrome c3 family protein [Rhodocyclaceae bacterium]HNC60054.1 cytochrome c3 family protein [Rhodocyclaceae bacterium]HNH11600.1 cytochrome c3 family protein [Rhodocyclaceae bacterium]